MEHEVWFLALIAVIAFAYSMVGHGGASGYLALLAFTQIAQKTASTTALLMNIAVASVTFVMFQRAKHFDWKIAWPFMLGSVPFAYLGGALKMESTTQNILLGITLIYASAMLIFGTPKPQEHSRPPKPLLAVCAGAAIGLLSGIVGIGGGIFLSPVLILSGWAKPHQTASIAAIFILVNSLAGLAARSPETIRAGLAFWPFIVVGLVGALGGSYCGANQISAPAMRRVLGVALLIAVFKLLTK